MESNREMQDFGVTPQGTFAHGQTLPTMSSHQPTVAHGHSFLRKRLPSRALSHYQSETEMVSLDYTPAINKRPVDLHTPLRVVRLGRRIRVFICITMYNESGSELQSTLRAVAENLAALADAGLDWTEIAVAIVLDGRAKMSSSTKKVCEALNLWDDELLLESHKGNKVTCHILERTVELPRHASQREYFLPLQVILAVKEQNGGKLNSHLWFYSAFCRQVQPKYCIQLDVGTSPRPRAIATLYRRMEENPQLGGCAGEIAVRSPRLYHLIESSQHFEYKVSHFLDKSTESVFGYVSVLPGAFSAYRWHAVRGEPLNQYFRIEEQNVREMGPFLANMYLAEDRILCFEVLAKKQRNYTLAYVKGAVAETDAPGTLLELLKQRRRWLNGSFFALVYYIRNFWQLLSRSGHSVPRRLGLCVQFFYYILVLFLNWFGVATLYLSFLVIVSAAFEQFGNASSVLFYVFNLMYLSVTFMQILFGLGSKAHDIQRVYLVSTIMYAGLMVIALAFAIWHVAAGGLAPIVLIASIGGLGVYVVGAILHCELFGTLSVMLQYLVLLPTYINLFAIYSFCNIHDISWGTKEGNLSALLATGTKKINAGAADVKLFGKNDDRDADLVKLQVEAERRIALLRSQIPEQTTAERTHPQFDVSMEHKLLADIATLAEEEKIDAEAKRRKAELQQGRTAMAKEFAGFRTRILAAWLLTNWIFASIILSWDLLDYFSYGVAGIIVILMSYKLIGALMFLAEPLLKSLWNNLFGWWCCFSCCWERHKMLYIANRQSFVTDVQHTQNKMETVAGQLNGNTEMGDIVPGASMDPGSTFPSLISNRQLVGVLPTVGDDAQSVDSVEQQDEARWGAYNWSQYTGFGLNLDSYLENASTQIIGLNDEIGDTHDSNMQPLNGDNNCPIKSNNVTSAHAVPFQDSFTVQSAAEVSGASSGSNFAHEISKVLGNISSVNSPTVGFKTTHDNVNGSIVSRSFDSSAVESLTNRGNVMQTFHHPERTACNPPNSSGSAYLRPEKSEAILCPQGAHSFIRVHSPPRNISESRKDFVRLDYTPAINRRPVDLPTPLRPVRMARPIELAICIPVHKEGALDLRRTLRSLGENLILLERAGITWKQLHVSILIDGRQDIQRELIEYLTELQCYDEQVLVAEHQSVDVTCHIFEKTVLLPKHISQGEYYPPLQILLAVKEYNGGKLHSHLWFYSAFVRQMQPKYCASVDVGCTLRSNTLLECVSHMECCAHNGSCVAKIIPRAPRLYNFVESSANFSVTSAHCFDLPADSLTGYVCSESGAFVFYRWEAIRGEPLNRYFFLEEAKLSEISPFRANIHLSVEKVLSYEILAKRSRAWTTQYLPNAVVESGHPSSLIGMIRRHKRHLASTFFAEIYFILRFGRLRSLSSHSFPRNCILSLRWFMSILRIIFQWFALGSFYLILHVAIQLLLRPLDVSGDIVLFVFSTGFVCITVLQMLFAMGAKAADIERVYFVSTLLYGLMMYLVIAGLVWAAVSTPAFNQSLQLGAIGVVGVIALGGVLYGEFFTLGFNCMQYLFFLPTIICLFHMYSFCTLDDVSWGFKEGNLSAQIAHSQSTADTSVADKKLFEQTRTKDIFVDVQTQTGTTHAETNEIMGKSATNMVDVLHNHGMHQYTTLEQNMVGTAAKQAVLEQKQLLMAQRDGFLKKEREHVAKECASFRSRLVGAWLFTNVVLASLILYLSFEEEYLYYVIGGLVLFTCEKFLRSFMFRISGVSGMIWTACFAWWCQPCKPATNQDQSGGNVVHFDRNPHYRSDRSEILRTDSVEAYDSTRWGGFDWSQYQDVGIDQLGEVVQPDW